MVATVDLLSTSTAARAAGVSAESIRAWIRTGRLPAQATPIGALIDPADLYRALALREAAQRARSTSRASPGHGSARAGSSPPSARPGREKT
jgi:hypothetical protein